MCLFRVVWWWSVVVLVSILTLCDSSSSSSNDECVCVSLFVDEGAVGMEDRCSTL